MTRAWWLLLGCGSCALPFVAQTPRPLSSAGAGGLEVVVSREVSVDVDELELELVVRNGTNAWASVDATRIGLDLGPMASLLDPVNEEDDDARLQLGPGEVGTVTVRFPFRASTHLVLQLRDAVRVRNRPWPLPAIELLGPDEALERPRASTLNLGVRLLGGALVAETLPGPLAPARLAPAAFLGPLEVYVGAYFRWLELNLVARAGVGRLVAVEVGVRPGLDFLTLSAGYGLDLVQVPEGFRPSGGSPWGHGPRFALDVAFDSGQQALGAQRPRRFGAFLMAGASELIASTGAPTWSPFVEGGLRWRWR